MYDLVVIGAGAVGLAIGRHFQVEMGWRCLIVESQPRVGLGISSRNSEVIHAGIYYRSGSLKAALCVDGQARLYHYMENNALPYLRCGKFIVAGADQEERLADLFRQAQDNGVSDVELLERGEICKTYPELLPHAALYSPSTGILSADRLMHHLMREFQNSGGDIALNSRFEGMDRNGEHYLLSMTEGDASLVEVESTKVINAAGLGALAVATAAGFKYEARGYRMRLSKGSYFRVPDARGKFKHLIYPLPEKRSLGIHLGIDLQGDLRLGPDSEYLSDERPDYSVDPSRAAHFRDDVRRYWPGIGELDILPDWAGLRPHIYHNGTFMYDFQIIDEQADGAPGWVNLLGIASPGLTASLAFGPHIAQLWERGA